jgi:hypothetical protein
MTTVRPLYVLNAFSLSMLDRASQDGAPSGYLRQGHESPGVARIPRPIDDPKRLIQDHTARGGQVVSAVGHADTAAVFSTILGFPVEPNRVNVRLAPGDIALVGQYVGPRLPEGATTLPHGATIEWWVV